MNEALNTVEQKLDKLEVLIVQLSQENEKLREAIKIIYEHNRREKRKHN